MTDKELAEFIAEHLPISTEDAEDFVHSVQYGYTFGSMDIPMALASRDKAIERLSKENEFLKKEAIKWSDRWLRQNDNIINMFSKD